MDLKDCTAGTKVKFTVGPLGMMNPNVSPFKMTGDHVDTDDTGIIMEERRDEVAGWVAVKPDKFPACYVPVHPRMIEAV